MDAISHALSAIKREDFLPENLAEAARLDQALPIGFGQTNSQPTTVERMLRWLEPEKANKILDVGSGSGWTTALLSFIVGPRGKVYAVERIPELVEFGSQNYKKTGLRNAKFFEARRVFGLPQFAPYDRILVSATTNKLPRGLLSQLKEGGKMVIPIKNDILEIEKSGANYDIAVHPGYIFVPLVD